MWGVGGGRLLVLCGGRGGCTDSSWPQHQPNHISDLEMSSTCKISGRVWQGQWPMIWLCEDIVAKTIHITPWPQWYLTPKPHLRSGDELAMLLYIIFREGMGMSSANLLVTFWGQCGKRYTHHPHPSPTLHTYLGFWDKHWTVWFSQWWLVVISVCYFPPLFSLFGQCVMRFYIRFVKLYKMFAMHFNSCRMMGKVEGALGWKFL